MRKTLAVLPSVLYIFGLHANTYYSTNGTAPNVISNWHVNRNGTGASPGNFTSGDIFVIQAGHNLTTTANWTVSGANAGITIESGATLQANNKVSVPTFEIDGTGSYIHNNSTSTFPGSTTRTLSANSTVEMQDWSGTGALPNPTTWGNLIINVASYTSVWNQAGNLTSVAGNLDIRNTGSNAFRLATTQSYTLSIGGDLIIENGTLEAGQNNGNYTQVIVINGSLTQSGGTFTRSNSNANTLKVQFNGNSSHFAQTGGTLTDTYVDWIVNASHKLTLSSNLPIASSRSLTVNGTLDCGTNQVNGAGSFTLASTGDLSTSNTSGIDGSITVTGSRVYNAGASYEFHAGISTPFPASGGTVSASNVVIDGDVSLNKDLNISATLTLTSGKLTVPAGSTITISSGSAIAGSGFGTSKQIVTQVNTTTGTKGVVRVSNLLGSFTWPIGNGTYYLPVTLTTTTTSDFSVTVFQGATANGAPNGTAMTAPAKIKMVDAVWIVNRNVGTSGVTMQLSWAPALEGSVFQNLADYQIGISHNGGYWESPLGSGNQSLKTVMRTNITAFSPFAIGQIGTPMPLNFGDVKVLERDNYDLEVDWVSYNEYNLDHFEVERSQDGRGFVSMGKVAAQNNNGTANYSWIDKSPLQNVSFYRINAIDIDNRSSYSSVVRVDRSHANSVLTVFPNPVVGKRISISTGSLDKGEYQLSIYDVFGRIIYQQRLIHSGGMLSQDIQLSAGIPPGTYSISIFGNGRRISKQFIAN